MKTLSIIGTIHAGYTPAPELCAEIERLHPDKVLVELSPEEPAPDRRKKSIRDEMLAAHDWAKGNNIPVDTFDAENDVLREGVTGNEEAFRIYREKSMAVLKNYTWKDLNKEHPWEYSPLKELDEEMEATYIDPEKSKQREYMLLQKIQQKQANGHTVALTGAAHLSFLKKQLPETSFPLAE